MKNLTNYYTSIIKYDLINKFNYKTISQISKLKKIVLNFGCKSSDIIIISKSLLALELLTNQKGVITKAKNANILLKIRKGNPVGCKVVLSNKKMLNFLHKLITEIFPRTKIVNDILHCNNNDSISSIFYKIRNVLIFSELEKNYYLFNNSAILQFTFLANTKTKTELIYLLNCLKIPFTIKKQT